MKYLSMLKSLILGGEGVNKNKIVSLLIAAVLAYVGWRWGIDPETVSGLAKTLKGLFQ